MKFKKLFLSSLIAIVISGTIGILLAYMGYGVWALVWQQISSYAITTIVLFIVVKWKPKFCFSLTKIKKLFSFGKNLLLSSLLETVYQDIYTLIIGKVFNKEMLGYYDKGRLFPKFIAQNVNGTISAVMLPALSSKQDEKNILKKMMSRSIVTSCFIIFPLMLGLAIIAKPLIIILLTEKWLLAVPFLQIMCIIYMWYPINIANLQAINAMGRSDLYLRLEMIKKIVGIIILVITMKFGIYVMALFQILSSIISMLINSYPNKKLLNYSYIEQIRDVLPSLVLSIVMAVAIYFVKFIGFSYLITMIIQIVLGGTIYFLLAYLFKLECFEYLLNTIKEYIKKKKVKE